MKKTILVNSVDGLVQEVITNFKLGEDYQIVILNQDQEDNEHISDHFTTEILGADGWFAQPDTPYRVALAPTKEFEFTIKITGKGMNEFEAYEDAVSDLRKLPQQPDSFEEVVEDNSWIAECGVCGIEGTIDLDNDIGTEWYPEAYFGDEPLGAVCPQCVERHCTLDEENGVMDVNITTINFQEYDCSPLARQIAMQFKKEEE